MKRKKLEGPALGGCDICGTLDVEGGASCDKQKSNNAALEEEQVEEFLGNAAARADDEPRVRERGKFSPSVLRSVSSACVYGETCMRQEGKMILLKMIELKEVSTMNVELAGEALRDELPLGEALWNNTPDGTRESLVPWWGGRIGVEILPTDRRMERIRSSARMIDEGLRKMPPSHLRRDGGTSMTSMDWLGHMKKPD
ncbi:hypothetical protein BJ165DRAFT_1406026 [Panaeolus papilionaceus]|nr:hypothetical protein BJ165DRAFT_1406026 [Panaeolus papilionaceus]